MNADHVVLMRVYDCWLDSTAADVHTSQQLDMRQKTTSHAGQAAVQWSLCFLCRYSASFLTLVSRLVGRSAFSSKLEQDRLPNGALVC